MDNETNAFPPEPPRVPKSVDHLPDYGILPPDSEQERQRLRQSVVNLVAELNRPDNFENFAQATSDMFTQFGIPPSDKEARQQWSRQNWQDIYRSWHTLGPLPNHILDLQIKGPENSYANINIIPRQAKKTHENSQLVQITPGDCSRPQPVPKNPTAKSLQARNFYQTFESVIGISQESKHHSPYLNQHTLLDPDQQRLFYVVDGRQAKRVKLHEALDRYNQEKYPSPKPSSTRMIISKLLRQTR